MLYLSYPLSQTYQTVNKTYIYSEKYYRATTQIRTAWWVEDDGDSYYTPRYGAFSFDRHNGMFYVENPNTRVAFVCVTR